MVLMVVTKHYTSHGMNLRIYDLYTTWPYKISDLNVNIDFLLDFPETIYNFKANGDVRVQ